MNYPDDYINKIIYGDCLEVMKNIPDNSIDAVVTDPPFGIGFDRYEDVACTPNEYWTWFSPIYNNILRVVKDGGFIAIWQTQLYLPYFWTWYGTNIHIYISAKNFVQLRKVPINYAYDPVVMKYKSGSYLNPRKPHRNVDFYVSNTAALVSHPERIERKHPCPRPLDVCMEIIQNFVVQDGLVLDPFLGSGTVALACKKTNRDFIGIELKQEYVNLANKRLLEA